MKTAGVLSSIFILTTVVLSSFASAEKLVTVEEAESLIFFPERNASAQVVALNKSKIAAEISAKLKTLTVNVGDEVKQGQLLAQLDCYNTELFFTEEQAQTQILSSQLAFAQRELNRGEQLAKQKNIGEVELDRRQTTIKEVHAQMLAQQSRLC